MSLGETCRVSVEIIKELISDDLLTFVRISVVDVLAQAFSVVKIHIL